MVKLTLPLNHPLKTSVGLGNWCLSASDDGKTLHVGVNGERVHIELLQEVHGLIICARPWAGASDEPAIATVALPYLTLKGKA